MRDKVKNQSQSSRLMLTNSSRKKSSKTLSLLQDSTGNSSRANVPTLPTPTSWTLTGTTAWA